MYYCGSHFVSWIILPFYFSGKFIGERKREFQEPCATPRATLLPLGLSDQLDKWETNPYRGPTRVAFWSDRFASVDNTSCVVFFYSNAWYVHHVIVWSRIVIWFYINTSLYRLYNWGVIAKKNDYPCMKINWNYFSLVWLLNIVTLYVTLWNITIYNCNV